MRAIERELPLNIDPHEAFALLHTPSAIRAWWSAAAVIVLAKPGGAWVAAWGSDEDAPDYISMARIVLWEPPRRLHLGQFEYYSRAGDDIPFAGQLETHFSIDPTATGCMLRVRQVGFPDRSVADEFHARCEAGWTATLDGIRRFVIDRTNRGSQ